ncbi:MULTISPECIES: dTDP-4-dehydrorhamnose reductase [Sulfitobacter]|uniref:dTDP-4-dehydrorhamnose reductase n=2 Tax=Sulfitobacter profundi TaxID=2679961 RepID=A0ABW1Z4K6_9RHOB|nr:dTDP-4-dehydrorhamnose reductase [Sulfitobacter indolifex]
MTILVFGKTGQVATELRQQANVVAIGRDEVDLTNPSACMEAVKAHAPSAVINAAAYTAVDHAENEEAQALLVNGDAPAAMAQVCAARDIPFLTISTDYVFDGQGETPWKPDDAPGPLGAYGRTKLVGEDAVRTTGGRFAILRTSWVFSSHGNNFVKTMLRLGRERDSLTIVGDQIGGPTAAGDIAAACLTITNQLGQQASKAGTYHFSGAPAVSWADFAIEIFKQADIDCAVTRIPSRDYPTPAVRPLNSQLDCSTTTACFGIARPDWRVGLDRVLKDLGGSLTSKPHRED